MYFLVKALSNLYTIRHTNTSRRPKPQENDANMIYCPSIY